MDEKTTKLEDYFSQKNVLFGEVFTKFLSFLTLFSGDLTSFL